jgi:hypothetical protein
MKTHLDMDKIAKALGAERRGEVVSGGGYFNAVQLAADIAARLQVPAGGGRATDPTWTERRLIPLRCETLRRLERLVQQLQRFSDASVEPMQLAAMLLEKAAEQLSEDDMETLVRERLPHAKAAPGGVRRARAVARSSKSTNSIAHAHR